MLTKLLPSRNFVVLAVFFLCINFFFVSCIKRADSVSANKAEILNLINLELTNMATKYGTLSKERIISLKSNLDATQIQTFANGAKELYISIAIKDGLEHLKPKSFLVIKKDENNVTKFLQIVNYSGTANYYNSAELFGKFYSQTQVYDGTYDVLNVIGNHQYELTYVKDKLRKLKVMSKKQESNLSGMNTLSVECTDWYWVSTHYYEDGTYSQTWEYVGRTCENDCPPHQPCEPVTEIGGGGGGDASNNVSKPKNWTVATGGGTPAVWRVYSDDNLFGKLTPADPANKGYFTSVVHVGSNVINYVGNQPGIPFSTWTQENALPDVYSPGVATSFVKGRLTFNDGEILPDIQKFGMWLFVNEF